MCGRGSIPDQKKKKTLYNFQRIQYRTLRVKDIAREKSFFFVDFPISSLTTWLKDTRIILEF